MHPQAHYEFFNREIWSDTEGKGSKRTGMNIASLELLPQAAFALDLVKQEEIITVLREINGLQALKTVIRAQCNEFLSNRFHRSLFFHANAIYKWWESYAKAMADSYQTGLCLSSHGDSIIFILPPCSWQWRRVERSSSGRTKKDYVNSLCTYFQVRKKRGEVLLFRIFKAKNSEMRSPRLPLSEILYTN